MLKEASLLCAVLVACVAASALRSHNKDIDDVHTIYTTKVFIIPIQPSHFNWNISMFRSDQFAFRTSLLHSPDLPPWMYYKYSKRHNHGFIYGVAPPKQPFFEVEIIALNRETYETRRKVLKMVVNETEEPALYEVQMKIDRVNIEDFFESDRYNNLLNIFRNNLWPESAGDLYGTFLVSAVERGARLPLRPVDGEGVVFHLGSKAKFSTILTDLKEEIKPLSNIGETCPQFKRTSVERFFSAYNFSLDWCAFQLVKKKYIPDKNVNSASTVNDHSSGCCGGQDYDTFVWNPPCKSKIPRRSYLSELALTLMILAVIMSSFVLLLSFILCFHREGISKRNQGTPDVVMVQYEAVQRATNTLRSLSNQRDGEDSMKTSPHMSLERNTGFRPNPPPYTATRHKFHGEF